ncbi:hypothetical protein MNEG_8577 [Monoraphidium neglectum]|uniref:DUF7912 domain-containing protein n=1 Tax=Monoraphidium neglectum TaxID=145388 RepID=A0A0D2KVG9_9CHLO|nr:hypothetical protein MNEG_8577 [Monoraphidium neglectum]KIY99383.1 hypothetical protein MNEG_8577 [Monoraphidium neglectum]|eukprot:XP_013898403.1 hypothetical protein MNEG_8577 [Monoraphidium neglectum]
MLAGPAGKGANAKRSRQEQKGQAKQQSAPQQQQQQQSRRKAAPELIEEEDEDEEGVIYLDGDDDDDDDELSGEGFGFDEGDEQDDGEDGGGWLDDDDFEAWGDDDELGIGSGGGGGGGLGADHDEPVRPGAVTTGGTPWGAAAVAAARDVLEGTPSLADVRLFALRCFASPRRLDVRLDKLTDKYGSPELADIETFSRRLAARLEELLGAEEAGEIVLEVSSPGAERELLLPGDLARFGGLPLRVEYDAARAAVEGGAKKGGKKGSGGGGGGGDGGQQQQGQQGQQEPASAAPSPTAAVLELVAYDEASGATEWRLADVRANAPGKGRGLSKRQREQVVRMPVDALIGARVHVDF